LAHSDRASFQFRAAPALELRRDEERAAAEVMARAEAALRAAQHDLDLATACGERAARDQTAVEKAGIDHATLMWHRNWIGRLRTSGGELARILVQRSTSVDEARRLWMDARQRRLALEKMRERALARFVVEQSRRDVKAMDEVARLRYVTSGMWRSTREH
jgi:flagellar export protein FliJ